MSSTVSSALLYTRNKEVFETAYFIDKVDKFFDSLNVNNFTQGKHSRKPFKEPYRNADDDRVKVKSVSTKWFANDLFIVVFEGVFAVPVVLAE